MSGDPYPESHLQRLLAEDDRVAELGIRVVRLDEGLALSGEVESAERRTTIERVVTEALPGIRLHIDIGVIRMHEPQEAEEL